MTELSDEFLLAYIDGQLEKRQASEVSHLTSVNVEISRRVHRLKRSQAQLIDSFGAFAREEIAVPRGALQFDESEARQPFQEQPATKAAPQLLGKDPDAIRKMLFVAAVFAGGVFGGYGATFVTGQSAPAPVKDADRAPAAAQMPASSWTADIARFHSFFPRETLTPYPDAIANPELIRFQLSKIAAKAISPPDFSRQGYSLFRGQTFNYHQERMMQITYAYASKTEPPVTLYVLPAAESSDTPLAVQVLGSNKAASWVTDHVRFLLTGEKSEEDLRLLAIMAQSQMPKKS